MNKGKTLVDLAAELQRREHSKADLIADTRQVVMTDDNRFTLEGRSESFSATDIAHTQVAKWADIPTDYYRRLKSHSPALLARNVNHWLHNAEKPTRRMIRTLDGHMRAFLSDRYRRIDNGQIAEAVLPVLLETPDVRIESSNITDTHFFLKAVFPRIEGEVRKGDVVQSGISITNSEIGLGLFSTLPLIFRLVCTNGAVVNDADAYGMKKYHVGRVARGDEDYSVYRDETIEADDRALMLKLQDTVRAAMSGVRFKELLTKMQEAATDKRIERPVQAVEVLGRTYQLNESERGTVLENLIRNGDYTRWGALNAITEVSNNLKNYDRASELEAIGGSMIDLNPQQWVKIAEAA